jgi:hypothetical protein
VYTVTVCDPINPVVNPIPVLYSRHIRATIHLRLRHSLGRKLTEGKSSVRLELQYGDSGPQCMLKIEFSNSNDDVTTHVII